MPPLKWLQRKLLQLQRRVNNDLKLVIFKEQVATHLLFLFWQRKTIGYFTNMKKILRIAGIGALIGTILTTWIGPRVIAWYFDPPTSIGVSCKSATEWAMNSMRWTQIWGLLLGTVAGGIVALFFKKKTVQPK
jgi:hypothetical protein